MSKEDDVTNSEYSRIILEGLRKTTKTSVMVASLQTKIWTGTFRTRSQFSLQRSATKSAQKTTL